MPTEALVFFLAGIIGWTAMAWLMAYARGYKAGVKYCIDGLSGNRIRF